MFSTTALLRRFVPLLFAATTAACDDGTTTQPQPTPEPEPTQVAPAGPYAVGTSRFELTDPARPEPHTEAADDRRRVAVQVRYPAAAAGPAARYFIDPTEAASNALILGLPGDALAGLATHATLDAPIAPAPAQLPVLIFSPGRNIPPAFYSYELEDLASRGYAVFALSHPYGAYGNGVVAFADGTVAMPFGPVYPGETRDELVGTWSADQRLLLDAITALAQPGSGHPLAGRLDLAHVGVFGHSIGGAAAAQTCLQDARVTACANLDGSVGTAVSEGQPITRPFLLMRAETTLESTLDPFFATLRGPAYQLRVRGAGHDSFSDLATVIDHLHAHGLALDTSDIVLGSLSPLRRFILVTRPVAAFFATHLQGRPTPLATAPELQLTQRP